MGSVVFKQGRRPCGRCCRSLFNWLLTESQSAPSQQPDPLSFLLLLLPPSPPRPAQNYCKYINAKPRRGRRETLDNGDSRLRVATELGPSLPLGHLCTVSSRHSGLCRLWRTKRMQDLRDASIYKRPGQKKSSRRKKKRVFSFVGSLQTTFNDL